MRWIVGGFDAGKNVARIFLANIQGQAHQLVGAFDVFGVGNAGDSQVDLHEVINAAEDVVDILALVLDFQRLAVVALAVADVAGYVDVRQKVHFDLDHAVALTGFAAFDGIRAVAGFAAGATGARDSRFRRQRGADQSAGSGDYRRYGHGASGRGAGLSDLGHAASATGRSTTRYPTRFTSPNSALPRMNGRHQ